MSDPRNQSQPRTSPARDASLALRLGLWLVGASIVGTGASVAIATAFSTEAIRAAALGGGAALSGVAFGLVCLHAALRIPSLEPGFAVVGSALARLAGGVLAGLLIESATVSESRPLWLSFLAAMACVIVAEVAASRRLLLTKEAVRA